MAAASKKVWQAPASHRECYCCLNFVQPTIILHEETEVLQQASRHAAEGLIGIALEEGIAALVEVTPCSYKDGSPT